MTWLLTAAELAIKGIVMWLVSDEDGKRRLEEGGKAAVEAMTAAGISTAAAHDARTAETRRIIAEEAKKQGVETFDTSDVLNRMAQVAADKPEGKP